ncbi:MAG: bifunctional [glutamate--ammonia ligase]-adenylyl-L-tyrosine phosphorylase/[glutamate--ammonia-ligase] adenylyltransferase [Zetaproteobacteria bacterium]|nr:MAG: bifunctional [glutamate--ammonia ligase]-adenylyl-L-tyrosine phosphorylase/[glutamate--ammonia-ligase] adenylyltransferase [Zetaproteobacteria bacterium]
MKCNVEDWISEELNGDLKARAERLIECSPWFSMLLRDASPEELAALFQPSSSSYLPDAAWLASFRTDNLGACMQHLRTCKRRAARHWIWWEFGLQAELEPVLISITGVAAALLDQAVTMARALLESRFGQPECASFCVIGLGKLGGGELNLGSDVDLMFIWDGQGSTHGGRQSLPAQEYMQRLARMVVRLVDEFDEHGQAWPVDMRLRPGGASAALCPGMDAAVEFYQGYGQTWERAMLIKARPVAGDLELGRRFVKSLQPFIYRRYLDYTTVAALEAMKRRIDEHAGRQSIGEGFDVKRGRGGIREIEFIVQALQLLHAGRQPQLRRHGTLQAIQVLQDAGVLPPDDASQLAGSYRFWRHIEHAIQARRGEHTHRLPADYERLIGRLTCIDRLHEKMQEHAAAVEELFHRYLQPREKRPAAKNSWLGGHPPLPTGLRSEDERRYRQALERMDRALSRGLLPERSREQVERFLDHAMGEWLQDANGVQAIESFAELIHAIAGRATWIDLMAMHEGARRWLIGVLSASRYVSEQIVRDPSWLEWPLVVERGADDLRSICSALESIPADGDVEDALSEIGRWVGRGRLHTALCIDAHSIEPVEVGVWLAELADAATRAALRLALRSCGLAEDFPFVALAMGKHGSREMGLGSDLDMVFVLFDGQGTGRSELQLAQRVGRRMIQYLTSPAPFGAGYAFDARLRPSGNAGVLVTTLSRFREYQMNEAQLWEHQALCRSRPVAGPEQIRNRVAGVVDELLALPRSAEQVARGVKEMRLKMRQHLAKHAKDVVNLKHDAGGLIDIEFLAQCARLLWVREGRSVAEILSALPSDAPAVWQQDAGLLVRTYVEYLHMDQILRVELGTSVGALPVDARADVWKSLERHAVDIQGPGMLADRMSWVSASFERLLAAIEKR